MKNDELRSSLEKNIAPIYLIEGEDAYLRESAVKIIENKVLTAPELNLNVFDGSEVRQKPDDMVSALMQYPFMSEKRVVLVRDYTPTALDLKNKALSAYFEKPADTSVLIIVNSSACAALSKFKSVVKVDCKKAELKDIVRYIQLILKKDKLIITTKNAELIAEYCKFEMTRIAGEVDKLAAYCYGRSEVTKEDIDNLVNKDSDYKIYEFTDRVAHKDNTKAYEMMNDLLGESTDIQKLFTALYYHFRKLFFCSISNKPIAELAEQLGMKEYPTRKSVEQASSFGAKKLKGIVDMFARFDSDFKVGKISIDRAMTICMGKILQ